MYRVVLRVEGYEVIEAPDGLEALRWIDADPPDLVILDLGLPRISGLTVQEELAAHRHLRDIPVLVVTASAAPLTDLNVTCLLRKPVTIDALIFAASRCLASVGGSGT